MTKLDLFKRIRSADRLFMALFVLLLSGALVPIWIPRLLPLLDQPNHLAAIATWNHLGDPAWRLAEFYRYNRIPVPYWGYYFPVHLLSFLFSVETANKLFLSGYTLGIPLSAACFAAHFGRSAWLSLLTFPFIFTHSFAWGFLSFTPSVPCLLFALIALSMFLMRPTLIKGILFLALLQLTYFMHVLPWMFLGIASTLLISVNFQKKRSMLIAFGMLTFSFVFAVWNTVYCAQAGGTVLNSQFRVVARFEPLSKAIGNIPGRLIMRWPDNRGWLLLLLIIAITVIVLAITARRPISRPLADRYFPVACFGLALAAYLFLPIVLVKPVWIWFVNTRFCALAALFAILSVPGEILAGRRWLLSPAIVASLIYCGSLTCRFMAFNERSTGLFHLIDKIPPGATTLTLMLGSRSEPTLDPDYVPFNEFYAYPVVFRGGVNPFDWKLGFPFVLTKQLPVPPWHSPHLFNQRQHGAFFDYVITHNESSNGVVFQDLAPRIPLIAQHKDWRLYATRGIR